MVSDHERRDLFAALERELGAAPAATLMELLPPVGWGDVARQSDLVAVRGEMAELRGEMAEVRGEMAELRGEMAEVRAELKGEMAELRGDVAELRGEVHGLFGRLLAANVATMAALVGLVFGAAAMLR